MDFDPDPDSLRVLVSENVVKYRLSCSFRIFLAFKRTDVKKNFFEILSIQVSKSKTDAANRFFRYVLLYKSVFVYSPSQQKTHFPKLNYMNWLSFWEMRFLLTWTINNDTFV